MAQISTHLNDRTYSVALTSDPSLPLRKWDWLRQDTIAKSSLDAAHKLGSVEGDHGLSHTHRLGIHHGIAYKLTDGRYAYVAAHR